MGKNTGRERGRGGRTNRTSRPENEAERIALRSLANQDFPIGDYVLLDFVGAGKVGYVYRARHRILEGLDKFAVKLVPGKPRAGWQNEIQKVAKLGRVPGVVPYHHIDTAMVTYKDETYLCQYTVWDFIPPGRSLSDYLKDTAEVEPSFIFAVVKTILHVLHSCYTRGVPRHGDLHAGNILIGDPDDSILDEALSPRAPIYVSDFGYGATGGRAPKDDYRGLAEITAQLIRKFNFSQANASDRRRILYLKALVSKLLDERSLAERQPPKEILQAIREHEQSTVYSPVMIASVAQHYSPADTGSGGAWAYQISEMLGERWEQWNRLFVPSVPARSRILEPNIATVLTGPRGCGKTMLLRRLSERLVIECGPIPHDIDSGPAHLPDFVAFYVNANDFADAFGRYPDNPSEDDVGRLVCYAHLCVLSDILAVQSARTSRSIDPTPAELLIQLHKWLVAPLTERPIVERENPLERYRGLIERLKWQFPKNRGSMDFPAYGDMAQHRWLPEMIRCLRQVCPWIDDRAVFLFVDDYSTPRVSSSIQMVLNRTFFQRSDQFVCKLATEASTTFVNRDSSGKTLQDADDYLLVDMGEESLGMDDRERERFLGSVFSRRLTQDPRVPSDGHDLSGLLGTLGLSKTEFARRLRREPGEPNTPDVIGPSQRRGATRPRVHYKGADVFCGLWSGDTRTMIQLVQELIDTTASKQSAALSATAAKLQVPLNPDVQDSVFRGRGSEWLNSHTRSQPTNPSAVEGGLKSIRETDSNYNWTGGSYGHHLKAVVEAFAATASALLRGPIYRIKEGESTREVPRMAFRLEIVDEFRVDGLAREVYRDLIRYGLFLRDLRGKSVRGEMVPRLYLRRLLLPYCTLALSKRDSVPVECRDFIELLLYPDRFKRRFAMVKSGTADTPDQLGFWLAQGHALNASVDPSLYDDLGESE